MNKHLKSVKFIFLLIPIVYLIACGGGSRDADNNPPATPPPASVLSIEEISLGANHSCALISDGTVKCWGNGSSALGAEKGLTVEEELIGDSPTEMGDNLEPINLGSNLVSEVVGGSNFTCARLTDNSVRCWGYNIAGQLGRSEQATKGDEPGEMGDALTAVDFGTGRNAVQLTAGANHVCARLDNGQVKCWGANQQGQLGLGDTNNRGDEINEMGDNLPAVDLGNGRTALLITAGVNHTCAILDNNHLKCWGVNNLGQLGLGDITNRGSNSSEMGDNLPAVDLGAGRIATKLALGKSHSCALLDNRDVKCWGENFYGQLGLGNIANRGDEVNEMGDNLPAVNIGTGLTVFNIAAGNYHTCVNLVNDMKCWGHNLFGQLGKGNRTNIGDNTNEMGDNLLTIDLGTGVTTSSIFTSDYRTCALVNDTVENKVKCWGYNTNASLGLGDINHRGDDPNEMGDNLPAVDLGVGKIVINIVGGDTHTCAILHQGTLKCWGDNYLAPLGRETDYLPGDEPGEMGLNLPVVDLGTNRTAVQIDTSYYTTCALLDNGTVKCWGFNGFGQLGLGENNDRGTAINEMGDNLPSVDLGTGRTAKQIVTSWVHTCAILDNGTVKCWGGNGVGELGLGNTVHLGNFSNEMGDNLPSVNLGTGRTAQQLAAGWRHTCALLDNGTVKCWGSNFLGLLGLGDQNNRGDSANEMGDNLSEIALGTGRTAIRITAGSLHTCALLDNGTVKCWGYNGFGQLGLGDQNNRGENISQMGDNLSAIDLGTGRTVTQITAGSNHTCALLDNGTIKCWGYNLLGNLGLGDKIYRGDSINQMGDNLPAIELGSRRTATKIAAGSNHTCALLDNGSVKCWGVNNSGELGLEDVVNRGSSMNEMGDNLPAVNLLRL